MAHVFSSIYCLNRKATIIHPIRIFLGVSDGSFYPVTRTRACAWITPTPDGEEWIQSSGLVPGEVEEQDPYRSELGGQLGLAAFVSSILIPEACAELSVLH